MKKVFKVFNIFLISVSCIYIYCEVINQRVNLKIAVISIFVSCLSYILIPQRKESLKIDVLQYILSVLISITLYLILLNFN